MGEIIETAKALVSPAEKLIDAVRGAIGIAYMPYHTRKMADAKAYEIKVIGQSLMEASTISIDYNKGDIAMDTTDMAALIERTEKRMAFQELKKQQNIEAVVDGAYGLLKDEKEGTNDESINEDWLNNFFDSVQNVSDEDMQLLWAKILAGEVKQPNSYSLRTLETLRHLSKNEALLFKKMSKYFVLDTDSTCYIPEFHNLREHMDIEFDDILKMDECGLINASGTLIRTIIITHERAIFFVSDRIAIAISSKSENSVEVSVPAYFLTSTGVEILSLFKQNIPDEFMLSLAKCLKNKHTDINITAHRINRFEEGFIYHEDEDLLVSE